MLTAKATSSVNYPPIPEGEHPAVCVLVADIGTQDDGIYDARRKVAIMFELPKLDFIEFQGELRPRCVTKTFTLSLHARAALNKFLTKWRGKQFTPEELEGFNLKNILGAPCKAEICHYTTDDGQVKSSLDFVRPHKGKIEHDTKLLAFDLDEALADPVMLDYLPNWMQERVKRSDEWVNRGKAIPADAHKVGPEGTEEDDRDGDVPF